MASGSALNFSGLRDPWNVAAVQCKQPAPISQSPVWNFVDIMALQRPQEESLDSSTSSSDVSEEDLRTLPLSLSFLNTSENPEPSASADIAVYSRHPVQVVDKEAFFYIEADVKLGPNGKLPVQIECSSGGSHITFAMPDKFQSGRRVFTYRPTESGLHVVYLMDATGKRPCYEFHPTRNYAAEPNEVYFAKVGDHSGAGKAWGLTVDIRTKRIYVADRDNHQILILDTNGKIRSRFGRPGHGETQFYRPTGLAIHHPTGRLFITDKDNHRIAVYTLNGTFLKTFGRKGYHNGEFSYPWGIAVSPTEDLVVVADSRNHRIQMFDINGNFIRKFSVFENNPFEYKTLFDYPRGLAFSHDGKKIYVTDFNTHCVFVLDVELTKKTTLVGDSRLQRPQGIAVDEAGNILIADSKNNCIRVISTTGEFIETIEASGPHGFHMPMDVAVLPGGKLVLTDAENRLRIF